MAEVVKEVVHRQWALEGSPYVATRTYDDGSADDREVSATEAQAIQAKAPPFKNGRFQAVRDAVAGFPAQGEP